MGLRTYLFFILLTWVGLDNAQEREHLTYFVNCEITAGWLMGITSKRDSGTSLQDAYNQIDTFRNKSDNKPPPPPVVAHLTKYIGFIYSHGTKSDDPWTKDQVFWSYLTECTARRGYLTENGELGV